MHQLLHFVRESMLKGTGGDSECGSQKSSGCLWRSPNMTVAEGIRSATCWRRRSVVG